MALMNLKHNGAIYRARGIIQCVQKGFATEEEAAEIRRLANNSVELGGKTLGAHAVAALHILNIEKYSGQDEAVQQLIQALPGIPLS